MNKEDFNIIREVFHHLEDLEFGDWQIDNVALTNLVKGQINIRLVNKKLWNSEEIKEK